MGRTKIPFWETINKFLHSTDLSIAQQIILRKFKAHIIQNKPNLSEKYIYDLFKTAHDFGIMICEPYEDVKEEYFKRFYDNVIGERVLKQTTIESYENRLKIFYKFVFDGRENYSHFSKVERSIKTIFKERLIESRRKLNEVEIEQNKKFKTIKKYLTKGINRRIIKNGKVTGEIHLELISEQKKILNDYYVYIRSNIEQNVGIHALSGSMGTLFAFGIFIKKPYENVTKDDFVKFFFKYQEERKSSATIDAYKHRIIIFYKYFLNTPKLVEHIKLSKRKIRKKESDMFAPSEIRQLVEKCIHPRDKCLVMLGYDSGARKEELLNLKMKNLKADQYGFKIEINGTKTENSERTIRIIDSVPYLQDWVNYHPFKNEAESYLFISLRTYGRKLKEHGYSQVLKKTAKSANINKRIHPHILRHSKATQVAKEGWNERDMRIYFGWSENSKMPQVYLHYGEEHLDKKILEQSGLYTDIEKKKLETENLSLKPKKCPRCEKNNPADSLYCNCGMVLNSKEALKIDDVKENVNKFTEELMSMKVPDGVDKSFGIMEMLFHTMISNRTMLERFKKIIKETEN